MCGGSRNFKNFSVNFYDSMNSQIYSGYQLLPVECFIHYLRVGRERTGNTGVEAVAF